jgi:hypothetical protein
MSNNDQKEKFLVGPSFKEYEKLDENKNDLNFIISQQIWPDFLSVNKNYPDVKIADKKFKLFKEKSVFFREGRELVRLKIIADNDGVTFECRVNPIKIIIDFNIYLKFMNFVTNSLPEIDSKPNDKDIIELPKYVEKKKQKKLEDEEETTKDFSILVEIRKPSVYIPSNSIGYSSDIQESILISLKEIILTSDQRIKRPCNINYLLNFIIIKNI